MTGQKRIHSICHCEGIASRMVVANYFRSTTADYIFPRLVSRKNMYINNTVIMNIFPIQFTNR